ncbi:kinesin-domain-containing protein [Daedalea quercina L-15889]|uniref:Kinesin-domain-containing protein n=1 Tax=Daedalea quercina L-15889 TaxID=1314783 RepID=A0A165P3X8_9APHY|nr:kinesin-domain-containing protein [Daedalea quercina L-15889]
MATRRAPSTRSRSAMSTMPPPASTRPKSAMAKSNSSQRSRVASPVEAQDQEQPAPPVRSARTPASTSAQDEAETNIQVVIRCRRRSDREIEENSPIIVTTNGPKGKDITIEAAAPVSSLGVVTLPPTRTYPFDTVFGPEADQALVYHEVVNPMLDEVLMGYNCTLFAYGQTGTGKTFTMQGDLSTTPMGNPSPQAGMIPRVLFRLFHHLESSSSDYSVKISFIELYNEELRDLLAPELAAPVGSMQPMGMGTQKDTSGQGNLKIFDDASKKGVFIQGLEEACVKDTADALALLTKGSQRRQIAATKFNDHSSRSHSVFSITVHTKETSSMGDDLLKVGKLNLVDLAGSENIGRSGAENKRAREAGMINQSLLTLGRVINALVDRSSHVPYRESKLTRLLQDSLGGRTKTCIIATISPARSNMEETLSTLDYAIRAKSIRNRPEVNQRMTRNSLLKEYVAEIERLKADVLAAREKNGIFFAEERWNQMMVEQELRETEMQESRKQVEIVESQLRNVREEFEQSIALLTKRDGELRETRERLQATEGELEVKENQLRVTKGALEEEVVVRQAHQATEGRLDGVATGLKKVAQESLSDLGRLHNKLERKTSIMNSNTKAVSSNSKVITIETQALSSQLDAFVKTSATHVQKLRVGSEEFQTKEREALASISQRISEQLEKVRGALQTIHAREEASSSAVETIQSAVQETQESVMKGFTAWTEDLRQHCESTCQEAEASSMASCASVETAFKTLGNVIDTVLREAQTYVATERKLLQEAKTMADNTTNAEILRLQHQNALLIRLLEAEKAKADRAKDELIKRVSGLLGDFTAERDRSLREAFSAMTESNASAEQEMVRLGQEHGKRLEDAVGRGKQWSTELEKRGAESKRTRDGGIKTINAARTVIHTGFSDVRNSVLSSTSVYTESLKRQTEELGTTCGEAFDRVSRAKRARVEATDALAAEAQSTYRYVQRGIASTSRNIEASTSKVVGESSGLATATDTYGSTASGHIATLRQATQSLVQDGMREDMPNGSTPRKRSWHYDDQWERTKSRDALLKVWRRRGHSQAKSETFLAEHLPLPEGEELEEEQGQDDRMVVDSGTPEEILEETPTPPEEDFPPQVKSLSSSASSTSSSIPTPAVGLKKPMQGVVMARGTRRRIQR